MSTVTSSPLDTLVSVKVVYEGNVRRFKLGLKDVGPSMFQDKLRELLSIPRNLEVKFERYSDSAGRYVTLDPENTAVYKQLFRAAKAKLKLRIKITAVNVQPEGDMVTASAISPLSCSTVNLDQSASKTDIPNTTSSVDSGVIQEAVSKAVTDYCSGSEFANHLRDTVREEVQKNFDAPKSSSSSNFESLEPTSTENLTEFVTSGLNNSAQLNYNNSCSSIFCDSCNLNIQGIHYHCNICDGGDFDLCRICSSQEKHCKDFGHTLIKRNISGAKITDLNEPKPSSASRLCNCCVDGFGDQDCVVCKDCEDYDLCLPCLRAGKHGHDPRHEFTPAHKSMKLNPEEQKLLRRGRNVEHAAFCDGCDRTITGIRHKCIDCPDWDYCNDCILSSHQSHPGHRFVSVLDNRSLWPHDSYNLFANVSHFGVYCDGPICRQSSEESYIEGVRYKCAICPDTDFCATCEASPLNKHNHTHPLIKLKIPIRNVLVTTTDGRNIVMGDQETSTEISSKSAVTSNTANTGTQVQTCVDVQPSEDHKSTCEPKSESTKELFVATKIDEIPALCATFESDVIDDGTVLSPGQSFTQTWYMKNTGKTSWPIGVTVDFVGGTAMFNQSKETSNITFTQSETKPGEIVAFSVAFVSPSTPNKNYTSYWRLTGPSGDRFGDNMWCSIMVKSSEAVHQPDELSNNGHSHNEEKDLHEETDIENEDVKSEAPVSKSPEHESVNAVKEDPETFTENLITSKSSSEMVFPKLLVESPVESLDHLPSSIHHSMEKSIPASPSGSSHKTFALSEDGDVEEEVEISSLDGFLTDEEYDVLDASDEEFERVA